MTPHHGLTGAGPRHGSRSAQWRSTNPGFRAAPVDRLEHRDPDDRSVNSLSGVQNQLQSSIPTAPWRSHPSRVSLGLTQPRLACPELCSHTGSLNQGALLEGKFGNTEIQWMLIPPAQSPRSSTKAIKKKKLSITRNHAMEMIAVVHRAGAVHSDKIGLAAATTQS